MTDDIDKGWDLYIFEVLKYTYNVDTRYSMLLT